MAESSIDRGMRPPQYSINRVYGQLYPDGINVADAIYFNQPKGLDFATYLFNVAKNMTPYMKNWRLDRGTLVQRPGTTLVGPGTLSDIIGLQGFTISAEISYVIRVTLTTIDIYDSATDSWITCTGPAFFADPGDHAYFTGWADQIMIQLDGESGGLYELDPVNQIYSLIDTSGGPHFQGAYDKGKFITTFAGRIIVCQSDAVYRMCWCTKDNNNDWLGIGSGFEDFFNAPGGSIDEILACIPVTDDQALVIRSNSIWLMVTTGNADAPFRFSKLYSSIACRSPFGIVAVPGAAIVPGLDDIYYVDPSQIKALGTNIRPRYIGSLFHADLLYGVYDEKRGEYVMAVSEGDVDYRNVIYRYSFADQGMSRDEYQSPIELLSFTRFLTSFLEIQDLQGTIGNLVGPISFLGSLSNATGLLMAGQSIGHGLPGLLGEIIELTGTIEDLEGPIGSSAGEWFVIREDPTTTTDYNQAFDPEKIETPTEMWTGIIIGNNRPPTLLSREKVTDAQLEYLLPNIPLEVDVDWSPDGGLSWLPFSHGNVAGQIGVPSVLRFSHTFESGQPIMRLVTQKLANMRTSGFHVFVTDGAMENP